MGLRGMGCPRCGGDLIEERYLDSADMVCLQCGHILSAAQEAELRAIVMAMGRRGSISSERALENGVAA
ncbi:MAG: hypothetical protein HW403_496 [Dehalococcoidia bacterium]|nr:hypothetical protein [Dehalococcoidia bacterium]